MATRLDLARRRLGQELGPYGVFTATSTGTTSTLICSAAFLSNAIPTDHLAHAWVYVPSATAIKLRRITQTGVNGGTATITVDGAFDVTISANTIFEISTTLPPAREVTATAHMAMYPGLNECVNLAARHILIEDDQLVLPLVSGQHDYPLSAWPWLEREGRLLDVRELNALGTTHRSTARPWELRRSPSGKYLHFPQPYRFSSGSFSNRLVARRPAETLIEVGGAWTETAPGTGMTNESDEVDVQITDLVKVAKVFAYRALRDRAGVRGARDKYQELYVLQLAEARGVPGYDSENDIDPNVPQAPAAAVPA